MKRFDLTHARHLHPPYGMWIVRHRGVEVGRQLSQPSQDDCERMLVKHREGVPAVPFANLRLTKNYNGHKDGEAAVKAGQRRGGRNRRTTLKLRTA